jgi:hypothetical protein
MKRIALLTSTAFLPEGLALTEAPRAHTQGGTCRSL